MTFSSVTTGLQYSAHIPGSHVGCSASSRARSSQPNLAVSGVNPIAFSANLRNFRSSIAMFLLRYAEIVDAAIDAHVALATAVRRRVPFLRLLPRPFLKLAAVTP